MDERVADLTSPSTRDVGAEAGSSPTSRPPSSRLVQLDGLRGLASLIVVFHHAALLSPVFALTYFSSATPAVGSWVWWLSATPLKLFTAGGEAVTVFFVLSGLVLTLPVLSSARFDLWAYYPRRIVRLYLPAIASVVLATIITFLVQPSSTEGYSAWTQGYARPGAKWWEFLIATNSTAPGFAGATDLLFGDVSVNNPLWSLRWEVIFSLLLPVFVIGAVLLRRRPVLAVISASAAVAVSVLVGSAALQYLPAFLIGAVIAAAIRLFQGRAEAITLRRGGAFVWAALLVGALLALISFWLLRAVFPGEVLARAVTFGLSTLGAAALVLIVAFWRPISAFFASRPLQWLGRISFSLYLVHVPILLAIVYLAGPTRWWIAPLVGIPIALGVAVLFTRFVELPSHRLSKRVGSAASAKARQLLSQES